MFPVNGKLYDYFKDGVARFHDKVNLQTPQQLWGVLIDGITGPAHLAKHLAVPVQEGVAGENKVKRLHFPAKGVAARPLPAVMNHDSKLGRETLCLFLPVTDDRRGTDEEHRPLFASVSIALDECQRLDRLTQPHVIGQASTQTPSPQKRQPRIAVNLLWFGHMGLVFNRIHQRRNYCESHRESDDTSLEFDSR
jgi:hypothetical protein